MIPDIQCLVNCDGRIKEKQDKSSHYKSSCGGGFVLACEDFGIILDHSFPARFSFFFFKVENSSRTLNSTFQARISPQMLSELRRLWLNVP